VILEGKPDSSPVRLLDHFQPSRPSAAVDDGIPGQFACRRYQFRLVDQAQADCYGLGPHQLPDGNHILLRAKC
jgi:hypothetical protein